MRRILVLTAVDVEARALARRLGLAAVGPSAWPHFRAGALEVACVGLRAGELTARATACAPPSLVVSAGACGALAPDLRPGALVVPAVVLGEDGARYPTAALPGLAAAGAVLTAREVVASAAVKARLWFETGALAVDMESGPILAWAAARGLPAAVLRGVADAADRGVPPDLAGVVAPDGRVRTLRAVTVAVSRPSAIADALTLRASTAAALEAVAAALARLARTS